MLPGVGGRPRARRYHGPRGHTEDDALTDKLSLSSGSDREGDSDSSGAGLEHNRFRARYHAALNTGHPRGGIQLPPLNSPAGARQQQQVVNPLCDDVSDASSVLTVTTDGDDDDDGSLAPGATALTTSGNKSLAVAMHRDLCDEAELDPTLPGAAPGARVRGGDGASSPPLARHQRDQNAGDDEAILSFAGAAGVATNKFAAGITAVVAARTLASHGARAGAGAGAAGAKGAEASVSGSRGGKVAAAAAPEVDPDKAETFEEIARRKDRWHRTPTRGGHAFMHALAAIDSARSGRATAEASLRRINRTRHLPGGSSRVYPELNSFIEEHREYIACRMALMVCHILAFLLMMFFINAQLAIVAGELSEDVCIDSDGDDVACKKGGGHVSICDGFGGADVLVDAEFSFSRIPLFLAPLVQICITGGVLAYLIYSRCTVKCRVINMGEFAARVKICGCGHNVFAFLVTLVLLIQYVTYTQRIRPTEFIAAVQDPGDPAFGWRAANVTPAIVPFLDDESEDAAEEALDGGCAHSDFLLVQLDFGTQPRDRCWRSVVHRQYADDSSLRACSPISGNVDKVLPPASTDGAATTSATRQMAACCVEVLPYGEVPLKMFTMISALRRHVFAMWLADLTVDVLSLIVNSCLILLHY